jgi:hypothetical protein
MTVKIDGVEPNIFPHVDDLDARDAGRHVEMFLDVRIEGKPPGQNGQVRSLFVAQLDSVLEPFRMPPLGHAAVRRSEG